MGVCIRAWTRARCALRGKRCASALLTYRGAWLRDVRDRRTTMEAVMAKMVATESAQTIIDAAVQMFGGRGVVSGETVERLYR